MNPRLAHILVRLYPRPWRERYGEEFEALLRTGSAGPRTLVNVVLSALHERFIPTPYLNRGLAMNSDPHSVIGLTRHPSAFIPLAMSLIALAAVLIHVAIYGIVHEQDEGATAHIWQLLMAGHLPLVAFFAGKWLPKATKQTLVVLAMLACALLANLAAVYFLT